MTTPVPVHQTRLGQSVQARTGLIVLRIKTLRVLTRGSIPLPTALAGQHAPVPGAALRSRYQLPLACPPGLPAPNSRRSQANGNTNTAALRLSLRSLFCQCRPSASRGRSLRGRPVQRVLCPPFCSVPMSIHRHRFCDCSPGNPESNGLSRHKAVSSAFGGPTLYSMVPLLSGLPGLL